ncbi:MAG TPA: carboxypeptidase-like regulatory domain-containing protein [Acidimicrobiales bacterium]|nr:carboxypeptidase-like regulatory domain-containing protein [Acidimicrobiales bacterium]
MNGTRRLLALAAAGALLVACTDDGGDAGPSPTTEPGATTTVVDRSGIALAGVPGETTSTIVERGTASISGAVQGPEGLVAGATVRVERLVAGREIRSDVLTGADGRFLLGGVPGGRYRIRAFLAPTLAQLEPEVRFLEDGEDHTIDLTMEAFGGVSVLADVAPDPPVVDGAVNLVAVVLNRSVDGDGVVRSVPVPGISVELTGLGRWNARGGPTTTTTTTAPGAGLPTSTTRPATTTTTRPPSSLAARTDGDGRVRFELRCDAAGDAGLTLRVPVRSAPGPAPADPAAPTTTGAITMQTFALELPACVDPAATTTTAPPTTAATTASTQAAPG